MEIILPVFNYIIIRDTLFWPCKGVWNGSWSIIQSDNKREEKYNDVFLPLFCHGNILLGHFFGHFSYGKVILKCSSRLDQPGNPSRQLPRERQWGFSFHNTPFHPMHGHQSTIRAPGPDSYGLNTLFM